MTSIAGTYLSAGRSRTWSRSKVGDPRDAEQREGAGDLLRQDVGGPLHAALAAGHQAVEVGAADQRRARAEGDGGDDVAAGQDAAVDVHLGPVADGVDDRRAAPPAGWARGRAGGRRGWRRRPRRRRRRRPRGRPRRSGCP